MPSSFGARKMDRNLHQHYLRPFSRKKYREGPLAFAHSLYRDQDYFGKLWKDKAAVNQKTTLIIWGMKDPVIKAPLLDKLAEGFPQSTVLRLEHAGHYPQEEYPQEVADAMVSFAQRNP